MIGRTNTGGGGGIGGGGELVIVGGTTSPAKANHNTIWLNTPNEITSHVLSATEPTNPVNGMAWVTIGDSGGIKMVSPVGGDWITVYPISAKQYVSGEWVNVPAYIYQGGEWVQFSFEYLYLFKEGAGITKGYELKASFDSAAGGLKVENDKITMSTNNTLCNLIWIEPQVDLKPYEKLYVELTCAGKYNTTSAVTIGVGSDIPTTATSIGAVDASVSSIYDTSRKIYEVPISNIPYERYIKILAYGVTGYIHNIWLE